MGNQFIMPKQVFYGENALKDAADVIATLGKKALVVTDPMMMKLGTAQMVTDLLDEKGVHYAIYSNITGEPTDKMIEAGLDVYNDQSCDFLIAVGGGSPIDSMKAIAAVSTSGGSIDDYLGKVITVATPPMVAIPTTSGTGSEATQFTIITNTEKDIKMLLKGPVLMPDIAIDDPAFTLTAPKSVTAATGLDALCHASEAYTSRKAQPLTDEFALSAIKKIFKYLPVCYKDGANVEARAQMSLAALEAGVAFNNASVTVIHGMSRPIGSSTFLTVSVMQCFFQHALLMFMTELMTVLLIWLVKSVWQVIMTTIKLPLRNLLMLVTNFVKFAKFLLLKNTALIKMNFSLIWTRWLMTLWLPAHRLILLKSLIRTIY